MVDLKSFFWRIRTMRLVTQIIFFLVLNGVFLGLVPLPLLLPVLQSQGNPQKIVGDAFAMLQYMLHQTIFPWIPLASFIIVVLLFARMFCGWICPFGFILDVLGYIKRKHIEISARTHKDMIYIKYLILGITLLISISISAATVARIGGYKTTLGIFGQAPFNVLSPHDTLFGMLPTTIANAFSVENPFQDILGGIGALSPLFWVRLFILALVLVFAVYIPRSWCKYFCPVGAAMALLSHFSFLGLKRDVVHCTKEKCRACVKVCPMNVPILDLPWEKFTHPECTYCLKCIDECKTKALKPKFP